MLGEQLADTVGEVLVVGHLSDPDGRFGGLPRFPYMTSSVS